MAGGLSLGIHFKDSLERIPLTVSCGVSASLSLFSLCLRGESLENTVALGRAVKSGAEDQA